MNETPGSTEDNTTEHNFGQTKSRTAAFLCLLLFPWGKIVCKPRIELLPPSCPEFLVLSELSGPRWASTPPTQRTAVPREAQQSFHGQAPACSYSLIWMAIGMPLSFSGRGVEDHCLSKNRVYLPLTCLTCWCSGSGVQLKFGRGPYCAHERVGGTMRSRKHGLFVILSSMRQKHKYPSCCQ